MIKGGSNLPNGQTLVGMFAYRLASGPSRVQAGVARVGEEGSVTVAMVFPLASVVGWDQPTAVWADMAWLAMRVHVGKMRGKERGGGGDVIDHEGEDVDTPPTPRGPKQKAPGPTDT